jgi:opacity protein-like surface antigen
MIKDAVMRKLNYSPLLFLTLFASIANASIYPIVTVGMGSDTTDVNINKTITILAPFQNNWYGRTNDTETVGSLFVGAEAALPKNFAWQLGAAYYRSDNFLPYGIINQFDDPTFANLNYTFNLQSQRLMLQSKLLYSFRTIYHPYLSGGIGEAINKSYGYSEVGVTSADVGMQTPFGNKTVHSLTYSFGLGLDIDIGPHMRFGLGYNFVNLGRAGLGIAPLQDSTDTLKFISLDTSEVMIQLSYVG